MQVQVRVSSAGPQPTSTSYLQLPSPPQSAVGLGTSLGQLGFCRFGRCQRPSAEHSASPCQQKYGLYPHSRPGQAHSRSGLGATAGHTQSAPSSSGASGPASAGDSPPAGRSTLRPPQALATHRPITRKTRAYATTASKCSAPRAFRSVADYSSDVSVVPSLVLAAALSARVELAAAGASSPRPASCRPTSLQALPSTLWTRLRPPETESFCRTLARGYARLAAEPKEALALAREAGKFKVDDPAQRLLEGRALLRVGQVAEAWKLLSPVFAAGQLDDAASLHDVARVAVVMGDVEAAEKAYRRLVPRVGLLASGEARRIVFVEAASLLLARGSRGIDEALGYLAEARAITLSGDRDLVLSLTALAHSRAGRSEQARAAAREADGPWDLENELGAAERARVAEEALPTAAPAPAAAPEPPVLNRVVLLDGELHAAIALLAEGRDAALMRAHWRAFLQSRGGKGPWAEHARKLLGEKGGR
jgi:hypothetical protein